MYEGDVRSEITICAEVPDIVSKTWPSVSRQKGNITITTHAPTFIAFVSGADGSYVGRSVYKFRSLNAIIWIARLVGYSSYIPIPVN